MPTSPTSQAALSAIATRSKRTGPGSAVAALVGQQQESQLQMQKLLQTIQKLQEENALEVQRAAQAGGGAATQVANQVAQGLERVRSESKREQERAEDKDFAREQQELNAKLQKDAAREAAAMGAAIQASRERYVNSINTMKENQSNLDASRDAFSARIEEAARTGKFASPEGRKRLQKMFDLVKQSRVYGDNMFNDKHFRAAFREHNAQLEEMLKSDDPMSVLNMQTDPLNLPMPEMKGPRDKISSLKALTPDQQFELELAGGYPPGGMMFSREENFGLPEGETPNVLHPATMIDLLVDADVERSIQDKSLLQEYRTGRMRQLIENNDRISKMKETHTSLNKTYNIKALQGTEAALEDFASDNDPAKFNDPGRYIMTRSLVHTFGGGSQGEEIAQIGLEFFDGKREPQSDEDFFVMAAMESASFNIRSHLTTAIMKAGEKGGTFATQLVKQLNDTVGKDETLRRLGVDPGGAALVDAQAVMQDLVLESLGMAGRMNDGMKSFSLYKQFKDKYVSNLQQMDLHAFRITKEGKQRDARLGELMTDLNRSPEEGGPSLEQLQSTEAGARTFEDTMTTIDAFLGLYGELGPDTHAQISGFIANHLDPVTSPDLKSYGDQMVVEQQRSGYAKAASEFSLFAHERAKRGKQKAQEGQTTGQAFKKGGVPQVVAEKLPALISMGNRALLRTTLGTAHVVGQAIGGERITQPFEAGTEAALGRLPIPFPGETKRIKESLTPAEIRQVIEESNRGN